MRICLVSRELIPFFGGGIGTYAMLMAQALRDAGHEVHVLTGAYEGLAKRSRKLYPGISIHGIDEDLGLAIERACSNGSMRHSMGVYLALERLAAKQPFDVIEFPEFYGEGYFALRAKRYLGKFQNSLMVVRLHTPTEDCRALNRQYGLDAETCFLQHQERTSIDLADLVVSPTASLLERVRQRMGGLSRAVVNPHPFDLEAWKRAIDESVRPEWRPDDLEEPRRFNENQGTETSEYGKGDGGRSAGNAPKSPFMRPASRSQVLYFGRLEFRKGVTDLVAAGVQLLEEGEDTEFLFIGGDTHTGPFGQPMLAYLRKRIPAKWRDRFIFQPRRSRLELVRAIRDATVCAFPSHWENFPNVCLEAMGSGATVVGSDQGGMAEIIEDGKSGVLVRGGDVSSLIQGLRRALGDADLRDRIRDAAPRRVAELCAPATAATGFVELCTSALEKARSVTPTVPPERESRGEGPAVSILVPFYNMGRFLPETLKSIRAQTFTDYEVIVIDDGSNEPGSLALLELLEGSSVRLVRKTNGGLSSARNAGLKAARGKWVLPLDSDDLIAPTFLEKTVAVMEREPSLGFVTAMSAYFEEDITKPFGGWIPWGGDPDCLPVMNTAASCTALMSRALIEEVGGYDEWLTSFEDWDLYCSLAERDHFGVVLPEFLFHYRVRSNSMLRTTAVTSRFELLSYLIQKHPLLATRSERTLRVLLGEQHRQAPSLAVTGYRPLRYRIADGVNGAIKRLPVVHPKLKRTVSSAASGRGLMAPSRSGEQPLRYALADQLQNAVSGALELPPSVRLMAARLERLVRRGGPL